MISKKNKEITAHTAKGIGILLTLLLLLPCVSFAQRPKQELTHYIGVRGGYSSSTVKFTPYRGETSSVSGVDFGLSYKVYTPEFMGMQAELNYTADGYKLIDTTYHSQTVELPVMTQGFLRFGGFRAFINAGAFVSYTLNREVTKPNAAGVEETSSYTFTNRDNRFGYGVLGGGGIAYQLGRVELQVDARYQFGLGFISKPRYHSERTYYGNSNRMVFSVALFYNL